MARILSLMLMIVVAGCGPSGPPPQSTDPAALEKEATQGRELRNQLEK
jgi:hypothetical protein